jgi:3D (Asp-Asp-Asp) domain-containing protein
VIVGALIATARQAREPAVAVFACVLLLAGCGSSAPGHARRGAPADPVVRLAPHISSARRAPAPAAPAAARPAACAPRPPLERQITHRRWLTGVIVTEYYPAPERWSEGALVSAPGIAGRHHVDWLYSAKGLSMEGEGVDLAGRRVHIDNLGAVGWVNAGGKRTVPPRCGVHWSAGAPYWRAGGWRNRSGAVTFPLVAGGWSNGAGRWVGDYGGATFAYGSSLPLRYYHSVAVDPKLIPLGSRIFVPAYRNISGGWLLAQDTGGAIIGRHLDVYRPPTPQRFGSGRLLLDQRVYVIPPGA